MVASVDNLATEAGVHTLRMGGTAVDAAIAANAVLTVTLPDQCGLGGDLFAIIHRPGSRPVVLNASGRSGSGADAAALRAAGHVVMPSTGDVRTSTVPGCVDGWLALHSRFGQLGLEEVLRPAIGYARDGFPVSPHLAEALNDPGDVDVVREFGTTGEVAPGTPIRRPAVARMLEGIARDGRKAFYEGEFGEALLAMSTGYYTAEDLAADQADWVAPLSTRVWGHDVWTTPPNSQGYLTLSAAWLAQQLDLPADAADPIWAHLLVEAMRQAAYDRPDVLSDSADGAALLAESRLLPRLGAISVDATAVLGESYRPGGTTYLCAVDGDRTAVSLIQSNAMGFGSRLVVGHTGVFLHNRGIGFSLAEGNVAEYRPHARPPHTLAPLLVTTPAGELRGVFGTQGGDAQPQILLQLLARLLGLHEDPAVALAQGRWVLRGNDDQTSFSTWGSAGSVQVSLEAHVPAGWAAGLTQRGHRVVAERAFRDDFGHAQVIMVEPGGLAGAADPRALTESVGGF
jgi:gamma-glutamyltranspeptidase / glutathione hydrolase